MTRPRAWNSTLPARSKPLRARTGLRASTGLARSPASALRRSGKPRRAPRDTGPSQKVRGLVLVRDGWQCAGCGKPVGGAYTWWSLQHRKARGVGGDSSPVNLIALCGSATSAGCHRLCEDRDADARRRGLWMRSEDDPASVPVCYRDGRGGEFWALLEPDGGLVVVDAPEGSAA
jgi:hypothetical protein